MNLVLFLSALLAALTGAIGSGRLPEPRRVEAMAVQAVQTAEVLPTTVVPSAVQLPLPALAAASAVAAVAYDLAWRLDHRGERRRE